MDDSHRPRRRLVESREKKRVWEVRTPEDSSEGREATEGSRVCPTTADTLGVASAAKEDERGTPERETKTKPRKRRQQEERER